MRWLSLSLTLLCACAHSGLRCQARGGPQWHEHQSAHFIVDTDAPAARAAVLIDNLETLQARDLMALVGERVEIPGRLRVLAFDRIDDFRAFAGAGVGGYYLTGQFGEPSMVVPVDALEEFPEALAHELAHWISFYLFPVQPKWFVEGLAQFVETLAMKGGRGYWDAALRPDHAAGGIPRWAIFMLHSKGSVYRVADIFAWRGDEDRLYACCWLLYHYLWNERGAQFTAFQRKLAESGDPAASWASAFPEYDVAKRATLAPLDDALERYRANGRFAPFNVAVKGDARFTTRPFAPAEVHLLLLALRRNWMRTPAATKAFRQAELLEAADEAPRNPLIPFKWSDNAQVDYPIEKARAAAAAAPDDWRGWAILGSNPKVPAAEREEALRKALAINPDSNWALNNLAWLLAKGDRASEALPFANRALDLAPWNTSIVDTLAEVAARLGKCDEAKHLEERAVRVRELGGKRDEDQRKRQKEIQQQCKPVPLPPGKVALQDSPA